MEEEFGNMIDDEAEEYDALNDETFGEDIAAYDWEEEQAKLEQEEKEHRLSSLLQEGVYLEIDADSIIHKDEKNSSGVSSWNPWMKKEEDSEASCCNFSSSHYSLFPIGVETPKSPMSQPMKDKWTVGNQCVPGPFADLASHFDLRCNLDEEKGMLGKTKLLKASDLEREWTVGLDRNGLLYSHGKDLLRRNLFQADRNQGGFGVNILQQQQPPNRQNHDLGNFSGLPVNENYYLDPFSCEAMGSRSSLQMSADQVMGFLPAGILDSEDVPVRAKFKPCAMMPHSQLKHAVVRKKVVKQLEVMRSRAARVNLSGVDPYAGMMTDREKYWLAGIQLFKINEMDTVEDDYYFALYQRRHRGRKGRSAATVGENRRKNRAGELKEYSPMRFENTLGGNVRFGSVAAPHKVLETSIQLGVKAEGDGVTREPQKGYDYQKFKCTLLRIEDMFGKIIRYEVLHSLEGLGSKKREPEELEQLSREAQARVAIITDHLTKSSEDFVIFMSVRKGKRLVLRYLSYCQEKERIWYSIFENLYPIAFRDRQHDCLLPYLPMFRCWLEAATLSVVVRVAICITDNLPFYLTDKFAVSAIADLIERAVLTYESADGYDRKVWNDFLMVLASATEGAKSPQKPVVCVNAIHLKAHFAACVILKASQATALLRLFAA